MSNGYDRGCDVLGIGLSVAPRVAVMTPTVPRTIAAPVSVPSAVVRSASPAPNIAPAATPVVTPTVASIAPGAISAAAATLQKAGVAPLAAASLAAAGAINATAAKVAPPVNTTKATASVARAQAIASKIAQTAPAASAKLASHAKKVTAKIASIKAKSAAATTKVKGDIGRAIILGAGITGTVTNTFTPTAAAPVLRTPANTGAGINLAASSNFFNVWAQNIGDALDPVATAGQILGQINPLIAQLQAPIPTPPPQYVMDPTTGQYTMSSAAPVAAPGQDPASRAALVQSGQSIAARCQSVLDNFDANADPPDDTIGPYVQSIQADATSWMAQANAALVPVAAPPAMPPPMAVPPYDPNAASGGGGGGGGGDSGGGGGGEEGGGEAATAGDPFADQGGPGDDMPYQQPSDPFAEGGDGEGYEPPADPFADDDAGLSVDDGESMEGDWYSDGGGGNKSVLPSQWGVDKASTPQVLTVDPLVAWKLARGQKKLADAQAGQAAFYASQNSMGDYVPNTVTPSSSFAERLAVMQSFLSSPSQGEAVSGEDFELQEMDDIHTSGWGEDITDEPADATRRTASLHHGAGYLQALSYPRYGASGGQEGGRMTPQEKIEIFGAIANGQSAYDRGADILGAGIPVRTMPTRAALYSKPTPAGNKITSLVSGKVKPGDHKASIKNAQDTGKRAIQVGSKLATAIQKAAVLAKPASRSATAVHGVAAPYMGKAKSKAHKRLTPSQIKQIAAKTVEAGKALLPKADQHGKLVAANTNRIQTGSKALSVKLSTKPTGVHGDAELLAYDGEDGLAHDYGDSDSELNAVAAREDFDEILGEVIADIMIEGDVTYAMTPAGQTPPMPGSMPPYGAVPADPYAAADPYAPTDPNAPDPMAAFLAPTVQPTPESTKMQPNVDYTPDPGASKDGAQYSSMGGTPLPLGFIYFDGSIDPRKWDLRSFNSYKDPETCFFWRGQWWGAAERAHDDWEGPLDQSWTAIRYGVQNASSNADVNKASIAAGWGPLVGAIETGSKFHGLRYDAGADKWFWFYDTAPPEFRAQVDALRLNQAMLDWKTADTQAKTDAAAQAAADQLDADQAAQLSKQQAADDLATSRQMDQEQKQAAHDAELQSKADEVADRQQQMQDAANARQADIDAKMYSAEQDADVKMRSAAAEADRAQSATDAEIEAKYGPLEPPEGGGGYSDMPTDADTGESLSLEDSLEGLSGTARLKSHILYG